MGSHEGPIPLTWLSSRRGTFTFPGIMPQKARGKAGTDVGRDISGSNRKNFHTATLTLWVIPLWLHHDAICRHDNMLFARETFATQRPGSQLLKYEHCEWKHGCSKPVSICPTPSPQRLLQNSLHYFLHKNNVKKQWQLSAQAYSF